MFKLAKIFLGFFTGGGAQGLAAEYRLARKDVLTAQNNTERLKANERMTRAALQMSAQTQGAWTWLPKLVRAAWALPFIIYTAKVVFWDKVLGWGVTDPLGAYEQNLGMMIAGFFFLDASISALRR